MSQTKLLVTRPQSTPRAAREFTQTINFRNTVSDFYTGGLCAATVPAHFRPVLHFKWKSCEGAEGQSIFHDLRPRGRAESCSQAELLLGQRSLIGRGAVAKRLASVLDGKLRGLVRVIRRRKLAKLIALIHPGFHQIPNTTALNRYPEIFACAANAAPDTRRILSFGCSTGEECVTLASYFPAAQIVGTDINPRTC